MHEHADIRAVLPQRFPLLLVDRILDIDPGRCISTVKAVTGTDACFANLGEGAEHWRYRYPYSLIIESFGQSAALLWLNGRLPTTENDQVLMFIGATDFSFEGEAFPGDVLRHEVRMDSVISDTAFASGEIWVGSRRLATVTTLVATRRPVRPSDPR